VGFFALLTQHALDHRPNSPAAIVNLGSPGVRRFAVDPDVITVGACFWTEFILPDFILQLLIAEFKWT
jgi:hypothetical protein